MNLVSMGTSRIRRDTKQIYMRKGSVLDLSCWPWKTLLYLLRRSYAFIYTLLISSEPVSEALLPVHNQLQTLRRCLLEVKRSGGVSSPRELYPYSMKVRLTVYAMIQLSISNYTVWLISTAEFHWQHACRRQIPSGKRHPRRPSERERPPGGMLRHFIRIEISGWGKRFRLIYSKSPKLKSCFLAPSFCFALKRGVESPL